MSCRQTWLPFASNTALMPMQFSPLAKHDRQVRLDIFLTLQFNNFPEVFVFLTFSRKIKFHFPHEMFSYRYQNVDYRRHFSHETRKSRSQLRKFLKSIL